MRTVRAGTGTRRFLTGFLHTQKPPGTGFGRVPGMPEYISPSFGPFQVEMFGAAGRRASAPRARFNGAQLAPCTLPCTRVSVVRVDTLRAGLDHQ